MSKYQFFKKTTDGQDEICYLCTEHDHFLNHKAQLLAQGFEVEGYHIYAPNEEVAIARFNAEMACPILQSSDSKPNAIELAYYREIILKYVKNRI